MSVNNKCTFLNHSPLTSIENDCNPFNHLPNEMIQHICAQMAPQELGRFMQAGRLLHLNGDDNAVWRDLLEKMGGLNHPNESPKERVHRLIRYKALMPTLKHTIGEKLDALPDDFLPKELSPFIHGISDNLPSFEQLDQIEKLLFAVSVSMVWYQIITVAQTSTDEPIDYLPPDPATYQDLLDNVQKFKVWFEKHESILAKHVKVLNLNDLGLTELPEELLKLKGLKELNLSGNCLKKLPEGFEKLEHLLFLDLSKNRFKTLPQDICSLSELKILNLVKNPLTSLPMEIANLRKLEFIAFPRPCIEKTTSTAQAIALQEQNSYIDTFFPTHWNNEDFDHFRIPRFITQLHQIFPLKNHSIALGSEDISKFFEAQRDLNSNHAILHEKTQEFNKSWHEGPTVKVLKVCGVALTALMFLSQFLA